MKKIFLLLILSISTSAFGQTLDVAEIFSETQDSILKKSNALHFDSAGNYCFETDNYFITKQKKFGPFSHISGRGGGHGSAKYTYDFFSNGDTDWLYKNWSGINIYGAIKGKIENIIDSKTKDNIALTVSLEDSLYYYINNEFIYKIHRSRISNPDIEEWCAFSESGNCIYSIKQGEKCFLFVNKKLIDSSDSFYQLAINNRGDYIYGKGERPILNKEYDYWFYVSSKDTATGPVRTVWYYTLKENGAFYYSGNDNKVDYIVVNNKLQKGISAIKNICLSKKYYFYTFSEKNESKYNYSGKIYSNPYTEILYPNLDSRGNFAFFGKKDGIWYKNIGASNNPSLVSSEKEISPLYISSTGSAVYYFTKKGITFIYKDDKLLLPKFSASTPFEIGLPIKERLFDEDQNNKNELFLITIGSNSYYIYNGSPSPPVTKIKPFQYEEEKEIGEIISSGLYGNGFYSIQKIGPSKFLINLDNHVFKEITNITKIFEDVFYNGEKLIFYGTNGNKIWKYTLLK